MSHFYGDIRGKARTEATRCGSKSSGIMTHIRSWNRGIKVTVLYDEDKKQNVFRVYTTGGSKNPTPDLIAKVIEDVNE